MSYGSTYPRGYAAQIIGPSLITGEHVWEPTRAYAKQSGTFQQYYGNPEDDQSEYTALLQEYGPVIKTLFAPSAEESAAVIQARIKNLKDIKARRPLFANVLDMQIRKLEARLGAKTAAAGRQLRTQEKVQLAQTLAIGAGGVAILAGLALTFMFVAKGRAAGRDR